MTIAEELPAQRVDTDAHFRGDIQGLRGIAVGLVLLFHASIPGFRGGFVGVDIFFVLSGYLITGNLLREIKDQWPDQFKEFYARRIRRFCQPHPRIACNLNRRDFLVPSALMPGLLLTSLVRDFTARILISRFGPPITSRHQ